MKQGRRQGGDHRRPSPEIHESKLWELLTPTMAINDLPANQIAIHQYSERKVARGRRGPTCDEGRP